jgi:hypothetical protein
MAQKTAVEWLEWLYKEGILNQKSFEIAKQKEKEQIIDAYENAQNRSAELYYNETYKK